MRLRKKTNPTYVDCLWGQKVMKKYIVAVEFYSYGIGTGKWFKY